MAAILSLFNGNGYTRIANAFLNELPMLRPASIAVYLALCGHCSGKRRLSWPSSKRMARLTGYSLRRVKEATADLRTRGLIIPTGRKNRVIVWMIPMHPKLKGDASDTMQSKGAADGTRQTYDDAADTDKGTAAAPLITTTEQRT